jgi:hypothetical protein
MNSTKLEKQNFIESILPQMKKRIMFADDYLFRSDHNMSIKLTDQVIIYSSGSGLKIIPLIWALSYPIIYDKHISDDNDYDVTIALCPITLRTAKFKGIFTIATYHGMTMILQEKDTDFLLPIDSSDKINSDYSVEHIERSEVKITTLRNALIMASDMLYMIVNENLKINTLVDMSYYSDDKDINGTKLTYFIHPKTLCYIVRKKKFGNNKEKIYIILGKDATKNIITGYDTRKSCVFDYLVHKKKLLKSDAYIYPMLWCTTTIEYPKSKILYITD